MSKVIMTDDLLNEMDNFKSQKDVAKFIKKYRKLSHLPIIMVNYAEELIKKNCYDTAMLIYLEMIDNKHLEYLYDEVTVYLRLGEYYINNGDVSKGKKHLIGLCGECSNYEEAIEFRELTAEWQKLKPYVINDIKPSVVTKGNDDTEKDPMTDDELLNLFLEESASGGFHSYLTSYGDRLDETLSATKRQNKEKTIEFLNLIKMNYFDGEVPEKLEAINDIIFDNDWWFEEEYNQYYYDIESELC